MWWVVAAVLGAGVVVAIIVLGFAGYELRWKLARLRGDVARLQARRDELAHTQDQLLQAQSSVAAANARLAQGRGGSRLEKAARRRAPLVRFDPGRTT